MFLGIDGQSTKELSLQGRRKQGCVTGEQDSHWLCSVAQYPDSKPLKEAGSQTLLKTLPKGSGPLVWRTVQKERDPQHVMDQSCLDIDVLKHWYGYPSVASATSHLLTVSLHLQIPGNIFPDAERSQASGWILSLVIPKKDCQGS